jgi:hypothetical protein
MVWLPEALIFRWKNSLPLKGEEREQRKIGADQVSL